MKVTLQQKILKIFILFVILLITNNSQSLAWSGYDYNNKSAIEIEEGNLVREGLIIQFYDLQSDSYITAKVILLEDDAAGVKLVLHDLDHDITRTFFMQ